MKKILVVEDEKEMLESFKIRLENEGFEVLTAGDGEEGLRLAREANPDLVMLDLILPKLNGYKICRMLKYDKRFRHIPVIILTAKAEESDRELGLTVGADVYITKPFEWEEIHKKIKELLLKGIDG